MAAAWLAQRARSAELPAPFLLADDAGDAVAQQLGALGVATRRWRRLAAPGQPGQPWPDDAPARAAALRLPKGRQALLMALHAVLARIPVGGPLLLYGHNAEGIRSAGKLLAPLCSDVVSAEARRHCRLWTARRAEAPLRARLDDWQERFTAELPGGAVELISYPGLFAHGRLDPATALLARTLPDLAPGARVLDFGCGAGALLAAVRQRQPRVELHGVDPDALALEAARRNLPGAALHAGHGFDALPAGLRFAHVVSNPPFHAGVSRDTGPIRALCAGARARLEPGGRLHLVSQGTVPVDRWLAGDFRRVERVAETRSFRVWCAWA